MVEKLYLWKNITFFNQFVKAEGLLKLKKVSKRIRKMGKYRRKPRTIVKRLSTYSQENQKRTKTSYFIFDFLVTLHEKES